jgi:predicted 3-demethylubiquinone-9 3-methyltransferase (glyoxalase superfamily)
MKRSHKITPFLWFDGQAEEAMRFYTSVFKNSSAGQVMKTPDGKVTTCTFVLEGQPFMALNGGPHFKFTPAVSLFVDCKTQAEVDELTGKLAAGGEQQPCGWVTDKFGLSWQIIPSVLGEWLYDNDPVKAGRVMQAMLGMRKIDIEGLKRAYQG